MQPGIVRYEFARFVAKANARCELLSSGVAKTQIAPVLNGRNYVGLTPIAVGGYRNSLIAAVRHVTPIFILEHGQNICFELRKAVFGVANPLSVCHLLGL